MQQQTDGEQAFHANIRAMKEVAAQAEATRLREAEKNEQEHLAVMRRRAEEAAAAAERRRLQGVRRRNEHNAQLRAERAVRSNETNMLKLSVLRTPFGDLSA